MYSKIKIAMYKRNLKLCHLSLDYQIDLKVYFTIYPERLHLRRTQKMSNISKAAYL